MIHSVVNHVSREAIIKCLMQTIDVQCLGKLTNKMYHLQVE
jgi:hypothetical protein